MTHILSRTIERVIIAFELIVNIVCICERWRGDCERWQGGGGGFDFFFLNILFIIY